MTSSERSDDARYRALVRFLHPAVAVFLPLVFASLAFYLTVDRFLAVDRAIRFTLPLLLLAVGALEYLLAWWRRRERTAGFGSAFRELVLTLAGALFVLLAVSGRLFALPASLRSAGVWLSLGFVLLQWLLTGAFYRMQRERELFLRLFVGRSDAELAAIYRDNGEEAGRAMAAQSRVRRTVARLLASGGTLLVIVHWGFGVTVTSLEFAAFVAFFLVGLFTVRSTGMLESEQLTLADGARLRPETLTVAAAAAALFILFAFILAIPLTGSHPLLPDSILLRLWLALVALLTRIPSGSYSPTSLVPPVRADRIDILPRRPPLAVQPPPQWALVLGDALRVLGWVVAGAALLALLVFLLRPIAGLRLNRGALGRALRGISAYLQELGYLAAARIRIALASLLGSKGRSSSARLGGAGLTAPRGAAFRTGAAAEHARTVPVGLLRRAFRRVVRWGERRGVRYDAAEGPAEYASRLAGAVPAVGAELALLAEIYEEGIYSSHTLADERLDRYVRTVRRVIGGNR